MQKRTYELPEDLLEYEQDTPQTDLFLGVQFHNFGAKEKKPAWISVKLNMAQDHAIYVATKGGKSVVTAYQNPDTGLFVTETEGVKSANIYQRFRDMARDYAKQQWNGWVERYQRKSELERRTYKPVDQLEEELWDQWRYPKAFYLEMQKDVNLIQSREVPVVNEYLLFEGEAVKNYPVTCRVPYDDPKRFQLTKEEQKAIDRFLDVFFDPYYKRAFSWYLGAMLLNYPVHHDRISKMLLLSSKKGGSGKSTLTELLAEALLTKPYYDIKPDFDVYFYQGERFASLGLSRKRLTIYSEAAFSKDRETHDFTGLNTSTLKSLITEGYLTTEEKHGDMNVSRLNGFHIVCTNHLPEINACDEALERRFLGVLVKPSTMQEKAEELGLVGKHKMRDYLKENAPLFASYFIEQFVTEQIRFDLYRYDRSDLLGDVKEETETVQETPVSNLSQLCDWLRTKETYQNLLQFIEREEENGKHPHLRKTESAVYLTSQKKDLLNYTTDLDELRSRMTAWFGPPICKYQTRMWQIPRNQ